MRTHMEMYKKVLQQNLAMYAASESLLQEKKSGDRGASEVIKSDETDPVAGNFPLQMTARVFAPLAVSFCLWVLEEAQRLKLKRIYFLSRDGYQFYRCAKELAKTLESPVEVRYLFVSRYSLRIPCFSLMGEEALSYICLRGMEVSFLDMMERAGLNASEAKRTAQEIGYTKQLTEPIPLTKICGFRDKLKKSSFFMKRIREISEEAMEPAGGYLEQEGLLEEGVWGIVDSGWTGTTQQVLGELLEAVVRKKGENTPENSEKEKKISFGGFHGFYFGLFDLPGEADPTLYHTWYFSWKGNLKRKAEFSNSLFEAVFSAPHGMVKGYEAVKCPSVGGESFRFFPKLLGKRGLQAEEMRRQTEWILRFTEAWCREGAGSSHAALSPKQMESILRLFMARPEADEAERYGAYLFSDDVTEKRTYPLAREMTEEELLSGHMLEKAVRLYVKKELPVKESAWYEGSAARFGRRASWHQRHYRRYKKLIYMRKELERKLGK